MDHIDPQSTMGTTPEMVPLVMGSPHFAFKLDAMRPNTVLEQQPREPNNTMGLGFRV